MDIKKDTNGVGKLPTFRDRLLQVAYYIAYRLLICFCFIYSPSVKGVFVVIWYDGRILIIKNSYKKKYSLPGGYLNRNECAGSAAVRELEEEVNIRMPLDRLHFAGEFSFFDEFKHNRVYLYEVKLSDPPDIKLDNREVIWGQFLKPSAALELNLIPVVRQYLQANENR